MAAPASTPAQQITAHNNPLSSFSPFLLAPLFVFLPVVYPAAAGFIKKFAQLCITGCLSLIRIFPSRIQSQKDSGFGSAAKNFNLHIKMVSF
jgi:hypothetical protein